MYYRSAVPTSTPYPYRSTYQVDEFGDALVLFLLLVLDEVAVLLKSGEKAKRSARSKAKQSKAKQNKAKREGGREGWGGGGG